MILLVMEISANAYFKNPGSGARPMGMGGAYAAAADDASAAFWNVAGLAQLGKHEVTAMFAALYVGLDGVLYSGETDQTGYHFVGYVCPSRWGNFGLSWGTFQSYLYDENIFCLSYGKRLTEYLCAGVNLKRPEWKVAGNGYTRLDGDIPDSGAVRNGFTCDLGALLNLTESFSVGLSAENLLPADVGLSMEENIPVNFRGGLAYRLSNPASLDMELLSTLDVTYREKSDANVCIGLESWFFQRMLAARAGWNLQAATLGFGFCAIKTRLEVQLDYALVYPLYVQETFGSHRMSMSVRF